MAIRTNELMEIISERTLYFLNDEMDIQVEEQEMNLVPGHRLELYYLTTLLTVGGGINVNVIFSYEQRLIEKMFEIYTEEVEVLPEERLEYIEETAGDIINIVVGNSTADFKELEPINLSPPIMISEARNIAKSRSSEFFVNYFHTIHGSMSIFCVGPKHSDGLLDLSDSLEFKEASPGLEDEDEIS